MAKEKEYEIEVFDKPQLKKNANVIMITANIDGLERYWYASDMKEFHRWWWDDNYGGPGGDDEVIGLSINGVPYTGFADFSDVADLFGFDKEWCEQETA